MPAKPIYTKGTKVWLRHVEKIWECAVLLDDYKNNEKQFNVQIYNSNEIKTIIMDEADELVLCHNQDYLLDDKSNLTALTIIHEASIFHILKTRFEHHCIYNYCGICTVVLNPFVKLPFSINKEILNYHGQTTGNSDPHIFSTANSIRNILEREFSCDQSIIFSGESGSGKTENVNQTILFLVTIGSKERQIKEKIFASTIILQAFGNAKTIKNDNSSRFGNFMEIQYDKDYQIIGASLHNYLFDRSRIIFQEECEQNFHIFYQMYSDKNLYSQLSKMKFNYFNHGITLGTYEKDFDDTKHALSTIGFTDTEQNEIFKILSAILHLGNISYKKAESGEIIDNTEKCFISDLNSLQNLINLFGLNVKANKNLEQWMCHKRFISGQNEILYPMTVKQAGKARDNLAKFIYIHLYNWIITRINASLLSPCNVHSSIGLLDMSGFENLGINYFEQFCINSANEKMQQYFLKSIFKSQQEEYSTEEIGWKYITFQDNIQCVEVIEGNGSGILDIINEEIMVSEDSNISFTKKLFKKCEKSIHFQKSEHNICFLIKHFINIVEYNANDFIEKNCDTISREHLELLKGTKNNVLSKLLLAECSKLPIDPKYLKQYSSNKRQSIFNKQNKKTNVSEYQNFLKIVVSLLDKTTSHYVKCIKTNDEKKPFKLNLLRVAEQLRAYNILEVVQITAAGFFNQLTYVNFYQRYHFLCPSEDIKRNNVQEKCELIVNTYLKDENGVKFGKTKIFLRENEFNRLEKIRSEKQRMASIIIQKTIRCFLQRNRYCEVLRAIFIIQRYSRKYLDRLRIRLSRENRAALIIQRHVRDWIKRRWPKNVKSKHDALIKIDADLNTDSKRTERNCAAIKIQKYVRNFLKRCQYNRQLRNIIIVQSCVRRFLVRLSLNKLRKGLNETVKDISDISGSKTNLLTDTMENIVSRDLEEMHTVIYNQQFMQAKNRILNHILFQKIQTLKGFRENQAKIFDMPEIEYKKQDLFWDCERFNSFYLYELFKPYIHEEEDCKLYRQLFKYYWKFDQRLYELKQILNLEESEIIKITTLAKSVNENNNTDTEFAKVYNDKNNAHEEINGFEGMLQFNSKEIDMIMNRLVNGLNTSMIIQQPRDLPAQIIFICIRYLDSINDNTGAFYMIQSYIKITRQVIKQSKQFDSILIWFTNTHRLLNYLKQYSKIHGGKIDQFHIENTTLQNKQCLQNLNLSDLWKLLYLAGKWMVKKIFKFMKTRTLEFIVPAILDNEKIVQPNINELNYDEEQYLPQQMLNCLLKEITDFYEVFKECQVDVKIILQIFKQLFDFFSSIALSNIMSRKELCNCYKGIRIRNNLRNIERWIANRDLFLSIEALNPIIQAARLLQMLPLNNEDIDWICKYYNKINSNQILKILKSHTPMNENELPMSQNIIEKIESKLAEREELDDTVLVNAEEFPVSFPFRYSSTCLKKIEVPTDWNLGMLRRI